MVAQYEQLAPSDSDIFPSIDEDDAEMCARLVCSIALSGDFAQWGAATSVFGCMAGFLHSLGATRLRDLVDMGKDDVARAVWLCLRCVPERKASECAVIIRKVARAMARINEDFSAFHAWDAKTMREFIASMTQEPVATFLIAKVLGVDVRIPSGGAINLMCRLALIDWTSGLLGGRAALRREAIEVLRDLTETEVLAILWWGLLGCDEACALPCPCYERCPSLLEGVV